MFTDKVDFHCCGEPCCTLSEQCLITCVLAFETIMYNEDHKGFISESISLYLAHNILIFHIQEKPLYMYMVPKISCHQRYKYEGHSL